MRLEKGKKIETVEIGLLVHAFVAQQDLNAGLENFG